jgi:hypothetical protein
MTGDEYLYNILRREAVDTSASSPVRTVQATLMPVIGQWAGSYLVSVAPSGSFAKGTANSSGTDIDLFISLAHTTPTTLKQIYESLQARMQASGYGPKPQNVSIGVKVGGYTVDLVPGRRQDAYGTDHSLYRRRADTWTKTSVSTHINYVISGGRARETRILKLWRDQQGLDFPSFYLELTVIIALAGRSGGLADNVSTVFEFLRDRFIYARVIDPANTNNIVSDELTDAGRKRIQAAGSAARAERYWEQIVR